MFSNTTPVLVLVLSVVTTSIAHADVATSESVGQVASLVLEHGSIEPDNKLMKAIVRLETEYYYITLSDRGIRIECANWWIADYDLDGGVDVGSGPYGNVFFPSMNIGEEQRPLWQVRYDELIEQMLEDLR